MTQNLDSLKGTEVDRAAQAVDFLLTPVVARLLDPMLKVKLDTLHADLMSEQEERREIARGPLTGEGSKSRVP